MMKRDVIIDKMAVLVYGLQRLWHVVLEIKWFVVVYTWIQKIIKVRSTTSIETDSDEESKLKFLNVYTNSQIALYCVRFTFNLYQIYKCYYRETLPQPISSCTKSPH